MLPRRLIATRALARPQLRRSNPHRHFTHPYRQLRRASSSSSSLSSESDSDTSEPISPPSAPEVLHIPHACTVVHIDCMMPPRDYGTWEREQVAPLPTYEEYRQQLADRVSKKLTWQVPVVLIAVMLASAAMALVYLWYEDPARLEVFWQRVRLGLKMLREMLCGSCWFE